MIYKRFCDRLAWAVVALMAAWLGLPGLAHADEHALSKATVEITNKKYNHDCFWGGPKGLDYGLLPGAQPIQQPVLYPDEGSTYFVGQFQLPTGASLTIRGDYPHERYFSFTVATQLGGGTLGGGDFLRDEEIDPDPGSVNPFVQTNSRKATPRSYTVHIVQGEPPSPRAPNTIYTFSNDPEAAIHLSMRNYIPDAGYDGTGNAELEQVDRYGLPQVTLNQSDGTQLTGEAMCTAVNASKAAEAQGYPLKVWEELVASSGDPVSAPAKPTPVWELFWDAGYSVTGLFDPDPVTRESKHPANTDGGFANNPDTRYLMAAFSLKFGPVYVIQGKMPAHPKTRHREEAWPPDTQVRYWSACTGGTPPSGAGWDCVWDETVPVDKYGVYTLVVSKPEDRPSNAKEECGVKWMDFGKGEGEFPGARPWVNVVYMRFMYPNPKWTRSPANIPLPSPTNPYPQDSYIMKEYFPVSHYETKAQYESHGCPEPIK
ncbi:MAG TPA: hypothetical protein VLQ45_22165 [Thermoanaerobaculia bacterium]|nr:hypothetical protein [Thermoanaerobaculia bacterium]